jgi:hypothetical protein
MEHLGAWMGLSIGAYFAGTSAWSLWRGLHALSWPATAGRVTDTGTFRSSGVVAGGGYEPTVRYEFAVGGAPYAGSRLTFGFVALRKSTEGAAELHGLKPGVAVQVYYDPRRPSDSVLRPGPTFETFLVLAFGAFFLVVSAIDILGAARP